MILYAVDHPTVVIDCPDIGIGRCRPCAEQGVLNGVWIIGHEAVVPPDLVVRSPDLDLRIVRGRIGGY